MRIPIQIEAREKFLFFRSERFTKGFEALRSLRRKRVPPIATGRRKRQSVNGAFPDTARLDTNRMSDERHTEKNKIPDQS
jgi:hypothetical protein